MFNIFEDTPARPATNVAPLDLTSFHHGNCRYLNACYEAMRLRRGGVYSGFLTTWGGLNLSPSRKFLLRDPLDAELAAMRLKPKEWPNAQVVMFRLTDGDGLILRNSKPVPLDFSCFGHIIVPEGFSPQDLSDALRSDLAARAIFKQKVDRLSRFGNESIGCTPLLRTCRTTGSIY